VQFLFSRTFCSPGYLLPLRFQSETASRLARERMMMVGKSILGIPSVRPGLNRLLISEVCVSWQPRRLSTSAYSHNYYQSSIPRFNKKFEIQSQM
jgi:hypothetical protein